MDLSKLSDEELMALRSKAAPPSAVEDVARTAGPSLVKGLAALATTPQSLHDMGQTAGDWLARQTVGRAVNYAKTGSWDADTSPAPAVEKSSVGKFADALPSLPRRDDVVGAIERNVTGPLYKPQTRAGRYTETVGELVPAALAGPGGLLSKTARFAVAPGVASEAAGEATSGTGYEPYARGVAGLAAMVPGALLSRPRNAQAAMAESIGGHIDPAVAQQARALLDDAASRGITLTVPEAVQQVTNSGTKLADLQRVVEASQPGGAILRPVMAERSGKVDRAVNRNLDRVAPAPLNPYTVGPRAAEAADQTLTGIEGAINRNTRPLYQAAERQPIDPVEHLRISTPPSYQEAANYLRNHPELGPLYQHLPDNSVGMIDATKKLLRTRGEVTHDADATEKFLASNRRSAASEAGDAATRANPDYAYAVSEQARLRAEHLDPRRQGPLGRTAEAKTTEGVVDALLPKTPLANSDTAIVEALRAIGRRDSGAASSVVRQRMEGTYNQASRDLQGGPNEWGGANYRAKLYGDPQAQTNIREAIRETAGHPVARDTEALMEALQATGRRQHPGSQTEFNKIITTVMKNGGPVGEGLSAAASKFNPMAAVRDRYQDWRYGSNSRDLATMMLDPETTLRLAEMSRQAGGSPQTRAIMAQLLANSQTAP